MLSWLALLFQQNAATHGDMYDRQESAIIGIFNTNPNSADPNETALH